MQDNTTELTSTQQNRKYKSRNDDDDDDEDDEAEDEENKGIWMCADDNTLSRGFLPFGVKNVLKFK